MKLLKRLLGRKSAGEDVLERYSRQKIKGQPVKNIQELEHDALDRATRANELIRDDVFIEVYQDILDDLMDEIAKSVPRETSKILQLQAQLWALQEIPARMNHWIATAAEIKRKRTEYLEEVETS